MSSRIVRRALRALAITFALVGGCVDQQPEVEVVTPQPTPTPTPIQACVALEDGGIWCPSDAAVSDGPTTDARDAGGFPPYDAGADAAVMDAAPDAAPDAATDAAVDATDAAVDATDAAVDAATDAAIDAGGPVCGNGRCEMGEDACNCAVDCANPMQPVCDQRGASAVTPQNPAGYCLGMCNGTCQSRWWRWSFWVTQYDVQAWNFDIGEHQGISIFGDEYRYDDRFAWNAPGAAMPPWRHPNQRLWQIGDAVTVPRQLEMRTTNPSGESPAMVQQHSVPASTNAFCGHARTYDTSLYNHGRTMARAVPSDGEFRNRNLLPLRHLDDSHQCQRRDGTWCFNANVYPPATLDRCFRSISDGLCDSGCGNCSYVAVDAADTAGGLAYYEQITEARPLAPVAARGELGRRVVYVGGNGAAATVARTVINYWRRLAGIGWVITSTGGVDAPFTHCVDRADEARFPGALNQNPQQFVLVGGTLTGIWGHNSNTDAEAERTMFRQCDTAPAALLAPGGLAARVCGVCGRDEVLAAPTQYPCRRKTNTARRFWAPTSGIHNVDDWGVGLWPGFTGNPQQANNPAWRAAPPRPIPQCNWGGFPVWGM